MDLDEATREFHARLFAKRERIRIRLARADKVRHIGIKAKNRKAARAARKARRVTRRARRP